MLNLAVIASGSGSNLQSIIDQINSGYIPAKLKVVISNKKDAYALTRAKQANIPTEIVLPQDYKTREDYDDELVRIMQSYGVDTVALAGYMRLVTPRLLAAFPNRVLNIHPALLPSFPGLHAQQQAFDAGVKVSGCTVHFVDDGMDTGPIIAQTAVPVLASDQAEDLQARILEQEHKLYPKVLKLLAEDKIVFKDGKVLVLE
jgi:phosphoribosylglycinamide formyltransferase-1